MIQSFSCAPGKISDFSTISIKFPQYRDPFPFLQIDRDSYIVGIEIQSGINFDIERGGHCVQIGKYCSLAEKITLLIDINHDYKSVIQGCPSFIENNSNSQYKISRKCSVLLQNDVWVGHGVTIMGGVSIHNGAVIGADSLVTKDVPEFAIVGGVPAQVIGYRFSEKQREELIKIAWWNWDLDKLHKFKDDFALTVDEFIAKHIQSAVEDWDSVSPVVLSENRNNILFIPDLTDPYPLWKKVLGEYLSIPRPDYELYIYVLYADIVRGKLPELLQFLNKYEKQEAWVTIQEGHLEDDVRCLFSKTDYFVTTRTRELIKYSGFADYYGVKLLYGTDTPIFGRQ